MSRGTSLVFVVPRLKGKVEVDVNNQKKVSASSWHRRRRALPQRDQLSPQAFRDTCVNLALSFCTGILLASRRVYNSLPPNRDAAKVRIEEILFLSHEDSKTPLRCRVGYDRVPGKDAARAQMQVGWASDDDFLMPALYFSLDGPDIASYLPEMSHAAVLQRLGQDLHEELSQTEGRPLSWTVLHRGCDQLWITLEAYASFDALKDEAQTCRDQDHCRRFVDPITHEAREKGCCIDRQCYSADGIAPWVRANPQPLGHGLLPHNRSNRAPEELQELCRLTRLLRTRVRESQSDELAADLSESEEEPL